MLQYSVLNNKKTFKSKNLDELMYNLLDQTFQIPNDGYTYQVIEVTQNYIARPDLISLEAYGSTDYTDIICKLNGISNPFELNEGQLLVLPSMDDITYKSFTFNPNNEDMENDEDYNVPIQKSKKEKRKPNESIIGDSRFKIDATNGIIIY